MASSVLISFVSSLGRAVNALDGWLGGINLIMTADGLVVHEYVSDLYSPRIEMNLAAGNRSQVTTSCVSNAILGPVAAGVGIIVRDASGRGGVTVGLDGGQS